MAYQKPFKKLTFYFLSNPVPFNGQSYQRKRGPGTSGQWLFRLRNKLTKISQLVIYYLTKFDGVIQSSFWVIPKIVPENLRKPIYDIINYSTFICRIEFGKCGKEEDKLQKLEYLENEKSFLGEMENIFHNFRRAINWWKKKKKKKLAKNSGQKL